ncbi:MAG: phage portal protein [Robiginitomaculum sp.]|nr:MAG: phage portal protein [Robiginitomaculum sp.]
MSKLQHFINWMLHGVKASSETLDIANIQDSHALAEFMRGGSGAFTGESISVKVASSVAVAFRCQNIIAGVIASSPIQIKDEVSLELFYENDVRFVLQRRPNKWQSAHEFKNMMTKHVLNHGDGVAYKVKSGSRLIGLIPMMPGTYSVKQLRDMSLQYTYTSNDGRKIIFEQDEVFHLRGLSLNGITGVSVIEYARNSLGLSVSTEKHASTVFKNGTNVGNILVHPNKLGPEAQETLRGSLDKFRGAENANKTLILEEGMTWKSMGMSARDAEFINTRKLTMTELGMFYGVPSHLYGDTEKVSSFGSGIEHLSIGFVAYTMNDWFGMWEGAILRDLLPIRSRMIADFSTTALLRGDRATLTEAQVKEVQFGLASPDEIRRENGKPARPDGKGGEFYPPPNMTATPTKEGKNEKPIE